MQFHTDRERDSYALGVSMYPEMTEDQQALLAFGMTDVQIVTKAMGSVIDLDHRAFVRGLMSAAKKAGRMIA